MVILHGSDLQVGRPYRPWAGEAFVALAHRIRPDVVVVAGDLTQRAKTREYAEARKLLDALAPLPVVVTPGNHDVPLYRVWERLLDPYRNWRRAVSQELDSVTAVPGGTVVALNSSVPRRAIVGGRLGGAQIDFARRTFASAPPGFRVVVTHHHFRPPPGGEGGRPLPGALRLLEAFEGMGVDLILGGHVHLTHLSTSRDLIPGPGPGIPMVACGTTASRRGRGPEQGANTLNLIHVRDGGVEVRVHRYEDGAGFALSRVETFPRVVGGGAASGGQGSSRGGGRP